jgi:hypothetical protein
LLTKPLSGPKRAKFVRMVLHHVFPEKGNGDMGDKDAHDTETISKEMITGR